MKHPATHATHYGLAASVLLHLTTAAAAQPQTDSRVDAMIDQLIAGLKEAQIVDGPQAGSFRGEMGGVHDGGVSTLATYALLAAGVSPYDPVIERAIGFVEPHPLPGTYSRSLRAAMWAQLVARTGETTDRQRYLRAMRADVKWLTDALREDGYYGYDVQGSGGDHSCSQFGVLGVWAARMVPGVTPIEVSLNYWERVETHWLAHQDSDGSWSYSGSKSGTVTMTTAGINTLYILAAEFLTQKEPTYSPLRGVARRDAVDDEVKRLLDAADRGFAWLKTRDLLEGGGYQLFGLERLGVATGRKQIGGVDWYRAGVAGIHGPTGEVIEDSFRLLFLIYGRAPTLMAKLRYGEDQSWNRYYRDLHFLTSFLSGRYECIYKWQIVDVNASLDDLLDTPILLISGEYGLNLTAEQRARLLEYVDAGGTIIGHADHGNDRFATSFRQLCAEWFGDRGCTLKPLKPEHALYTASGEAGAAWAGDFCIEGVDDGVRTCVFLFPNDLAGAWHQNRRDKHANMFDVMSNMTVYAAGEYAQLPKRLRPPELAGSSAPPAGYLTVDTLRVGGAGIQTLGKWLTVGRRLDHETGVSILAACPPPDISDTAAPGQSGPAAASGTAPSAGDPAPAARTERTATQSAAQAWSISADILHVTGTDVFNVDENLVDALAQRITAGGFVWLEAAGGNEAWVRSSAALFDAVARRIGGEIRPVDREHALLAGELTAGTRAGALRPNRWGLVSLRGTAPPIRVMTHNGRMAAVLMPFDALATAAGHRVYQAPAYASDDTARLLRNMLLLRYLDVTGGKRAATQLPARVPRALDEPIRGLIDAGRFAEAIQWIAAVERLGPHTEELDEWRALLRSRMLVAYRDARAGQREADASRLARQLVTVFPDDMRELARAHDRESSSAAPHGDVVDAPRELSPELRDIEIVYDDQTTDARWLLLEWQKKRDEHDEWQGKLADERTALEALDLRAKELIREQARGGRGGSRGGGEFDRIAAERKIIEDRARKAERAANECIMTMNRITRALTPHEEAIARLGWVVRDGLWGPKEEPTTAP